MFVEHISDISVIMKRILQGKWMTAEGLGVERWNRQYTGEHNITHLLRE